MGKNPPVRIHKKQKRMPRNALKKKELFFLNLEMIYTKQKSSYTYGNAPSLLTLQLMNEFNLSFKYRIPGYIWKECQSGNSLDK